MSGTEIDRLLGGVISGGQEDKLYGVTVVYVRLPNGDQVRLRPHSYHGMDEEIIVEDGWFGEG